MRDSATSTDDAAGRAEAPAATTLKCDTPPSSMLRAPASSANGHRFAQCVLVVLVVLLAFLVPLAVAKELNASDVDGGARVAAPVLSARGALVRSLAALRTAASRVSSAIASRAGVLVPAVLMAVAATIAQVGSTVRLPGWAQWVVGGTLLTAACALAWREADVQLGGGRGRGGSIEPDTAADERRLGLFEAELHAMLAPAGSAAAATAAPFVSWARSWLRAAGAAGVGGGAAHMLVVFGESGGKRANFVIELAARLLVSSPSRRLDIDASRDCNSTVDGGCNARVQAHLVMASRDRERALVIMRHVETCTTDQLYDDVLSVIERLLDETPAVLPTANGDVRKALASFILFAPCLTRDECVRRESKGIAQDGALEALWPHAGYSKAVQIARRAFINRLGTALTVVCE